MPKRVLRFQVRHGHLHDVKTGKVAVLLLTKPRTGWSSAVIDKELAEKRMFSPEIARALIEGMDLVRLRTAVLNLSPELEHLDFIAKRTAVDTVCNNLRIEFVHQGSCLRIVAGGSGEQIIECRDDLYHAA